MHIDSVSNREAFDAVKEIATKIFNEQWIAFRARRLFFFKHEGIIDADSYDEKLRKNKILVFKIPFFSRIFIAIIHTY